MGDMEGREHLPWTERGEQWWDVGWRAFACSLLGRVWVAWGQEQHLCEGGDKCEQAEQMALDRPGVLVTAEYCQAETALPAGWWWWGERLPLRWAPTSCERLTSTQLQED